MIRIFHYRKKCIGCYACVVAAGDRWRISRKDGKSILIEGIEKKGIYTTIAGDHEYDVNRNAAKACPVNIIRVEKY